MDGKKKYKDEIFSCCVVSQYHRSNHTRLQVRIDVAVLISCSIQQVYPEAEAIVGLGIHIHVVTYHSLPITSSSSWM